MAEKKDKKAQEKRIFGSTMTEGEKKAKKKKDTRKEIFGATITEKEKMVHLQKVGKKPKETTTN